ncbi:pleiotropic drug resistance protein [Cryptococcus neoformans]|nr:hypothetical protein AYX13_03353 [Cryptococcus neoformans var. grubii]OXG29582.1 pleiotropic drug resistance protein [Cryptococcus neoformans var. grubii Ze90-1]OXH37721.1 pleiotropic drug resistance protein [Cryptococcus neoformans var. grubii]
MSFFKSRSASASTASLKPESLGPKTSDVLTVPPQESSVKKRWEYDDHQLGLIAQLKEYTKTIALPESDQYYPWEQRFLSDPATHARYMRAAKWKLHDGKNRIKGTLEWRRTYKPELISPDDVGIEAETGKIILTGFDMDARPILYMRPGRENTETSPRQIRHLIYHLERAIDLMPPGQEQVAIIVDYKSATSQSNPSIGTARKVLHILQNHYVERLGRGLVVNMPWWINAFFSGISPFMDPITRDKIRFNPRLLDLVPAAHLDSEFGGDYNFEYDYSVYWKTITEFCHIAPDGKRVPPPHKEEEGKGKQGWIPPAGNGIKAAVEGYVPKEGTVKSGEIVKAGEEGEKTEKGAAATGANNVADATPTASSATSPAPPEKEMESLAIQTAPGEPVGGPVFDHPPSEGEVNEAKKSLNVSA